MSLDKERGIRIQFYMKYIQQAFLMMKLCPWLGCILNYLQALMEDEVIIEIGSLLSSEFDIMDLQWRFDGVRWFLKVALWVYMKKWLNCERRGFNL